MSARVVLVAMLFVWPALVFAAGPRGPDVVVLDQLVERYGPVTFDHKGHADMADMGKGCEACHHRKPLAATRPAGSTGSPQATTLRAGHVVQADADAVPACRSCHAPGEDKADLHVPSLKGAYHRQCLNCHRDWSGENDCVICHVPVDGNGKKPAAASKDDILGRMHPPIPEPERVEFRARFTPVDGPNVVFRHKEHTGAYGLRCVDCHHRDTCADCHANTEAAPTTMRAGPRPMKPGRTWKESHAPCGSCHEGDRCRECHYPEGGTTPPPFAHASTGQGMDKDHEKLACGKCHVDVKRSSRVTCGGTECHAKAQTPLTYPAARPGPVTAKTRGWPAATRPTTRSAPTTRATVVRVRVGG